MVRIMSRPIQDIAEELFSELEAAKEVPFVSDDDFEELFLESGDPAHVLEVLRIIAADERNVAYFQQCRDFLAPNLSSESPIETIQHLRSLADARQSGLSEIERLRDAEGTPQWLKELAHAEVHKHVDSASDDSLHIAPSWLAATLRSLTEKYGWPNDQRVETLSGEDVSVASDFSLTKGAETFHGPDALAGAAAGGHFGAGETLTPAYVEVKAIDETTLKVTVEVDPRDKRGTETYLLAGSPSKGIWRSVRLDEREGGTFEATVGGEFSAFVASLEDTFYAVLFNE